MRVQINNRDEAIMALSNGVHQNRVGMRLSAPILPPMPLGHALQLVDGIQLPLSAVHDAERGKYQL